MIPSAVMVHLHSPDKQGIASLPPLTVIDLDERYYSLSVPKLSAVSPSIGTDCLRERACNFNRIERAALPRISLYKISVSLVTEYRLRFKY